MQNDPIVDAVHRIRESLAGQFDFNVRAVFADMRTREPLVGSRLMRPKPSPNKPMLPSNGPGSSGLPSSTPTTGERGN